MLWVYVWGAVSAVAIVGVVFALLRTVEKPKPPRPGDDPVAVARYVAAPEFLALGFDEQRPFYYALRKATDPLKAARHDGRLDERQYLYARAAGWTGAKLEHLAHYEKLKTDAAKREFLDKVVLRRLDKKTHTSQAVASGTGNAPGLDDGSFAQSAEVKLFVASWTKRRRTEWDEFLKATHERKVALCEARTAATAPTTAATTTPAPTRTTAATVINPGDTPPTPR